MSSVANLLVEIGTEELPPKALRDLKDAFATQLTSGLADARLEHGEVQSFASPRRLTVVVADLVAQQEERRVEQKGPPEKIAFDDSGEATPAALAFAKKCGVSVAELSRVDTDKGVWLAHSSVEAGQSIDDLLPSIIEKALAALPIPRRMRWGAGEAEFVRPIHWSVLLHGERVIDATILGIKTGNDSQGHRFHAPGPIRIPSADAYLDTLEKEGFVIADFERRREMVREGVDAAAASAGGEVVEADALYDEVAALVEWPVPVVGRFDKKFLELPREVVVSTLTGHQRYFPVAGADGKLLPTFITVANLESKDPNQVRDGNERVILPRLADAAFFWQNDRQQTLESRRDNLADVVYQRGLGSMLDKSERVRKIGGAVAALTGDEDDAVCRAAELAKCDLITGLVGEFPELQGTMGRYYATADNEPEAVAAAIGEHYLPRFAGDELPESSAGQLLAVADKLDTLAGVFSIGKKPSGNRDPFGLRRAALGVIRILVECGLDANLRTILKTAVTAQPKGKLSNDDVVDDLYTYFMDRLRGYFLDRDPKLQVETFEAVLDREPETLLDFDRRLAAVQTFAHLEQAASLAAANKRIANILRKANVPSDVRISKKLFEADAETALHNAMLASKDVVVPLLERRSYAEVLNELAGLRDHVDRYFDDVMVMADDEAVRNNRLALLSKLRALFLNVADISRLSIA